jgi:putative ABC transport system substrate-binding protein
MAAFRQGLQNLGWIEGRNVHIEERWPGGNAERLRSFAAELVGMRPDAIFAGNEAATMALYRTASNVKYQPPSILLFPEEPKNE